MIESFVTGVQLVSAAAVLSFLAHYLTVVRFRAARRSLVSWYLVVNALVMAQVLCLALVSAFAGRDWPGRDAVRLVVYAEMAAGLVAQYALLLDSIRRRHRQEGDSR